MPVAEAQRQRERKRLTNTLRRHRCPSGVGFNQRFRVLIWPLCVYSTPADLHLAGSARSASASHRLSVCSSAGRKSRWCSPSHKNCGSAPGRAQASTPGSGGSSRPSLRAATAEGCKDSCRSVPVIHPADCSEPRDEQLCPAWGE